MLSNNLETDVDFFGLGTIQGGLIFVMVILR